MKIRCIVFIFFIAALFSLLFVGTIGFFSPQAPPMLTCGNCSLIIEPDDGIAPVMAMIENATASIDLVMYELEDTNLESALVSAAHRNVAVRVLLDSGYGGKSGPNQPAYDFLKSNGVNVKWTPDYFALTHEKSLVVDHAKALVMTFNLTSEYYSTSRDFGIIDDEPHDVGAMEEVFNADWKSLGIAAPSDDTLIWSPGSRDALIALINGAVHSLDIYNEEMADAEIETALINAASRGVTVNVLMTYSSDWKKAFSKLAVSGVNIRTYKSNAPLYIHAKMILADNTLAFVGSENFSAASLDHNRELGLMITNSATIHALLETFNTDWHGAATF